ncbi:MAG: NAD(P)-binding protein [Proteobacteria bacterium]|nr:NAD(P)-binding protein [Pseudomonadota bacterium]
MTLALLLGMNGHSVLLLEKNKHIGGSLTRFYRQGIPFDTGFHFTGGFYKNGILHDMLTVLGIHDYIKPIYISQSENNCFIFEEKQAVFELPIGYNAIISKIKEKFPSESIAIERYFDMVKAVCSKTVSMDLRKITLSPKVIDEDYISLDRVLNNLTDNRLLKGLLSGYCMCYGVKPAEISFANHSRVSYGLYESIARVKDGGDAFIKAFKERFSEFNIDVKCGCFINELVDIKNNHVGRFVLNNGDEISCKRCIFTIHPLEILKILPHKHLTKAFLERVKSFEPSAGFFSVYGVVESDDTSDAFNPSILSLFPTDDINLLVDPSNPGPPALVIMKNLERGKGKSYKVVNACEVSFPEHVKAWEDSKPGKRPDGYIKYKQERINNITKRIIDAYPKYSDSFKVVDAASILTFRDYLHSPDGSAYGVKQKIGQFNLFGKLPLRNLYAAGQSSVLPGLVGSMMSSFIVGRAVVGKEDYNRFIEKRLVT